MRRDSIYQTFGDIVDVSPATPAAAPLYTVRVVTDQGDKVFDNVRPAKWFWDDLGVDEDGAKTVQRPDGRKTLVECIRQGDMWYFDFVPAPLVGTCTGTESLVPMLLAKIADLEARVAAMENA